jgi:hypothetical protein
MEIQELAQHGQPLVEVVEVVLVVLELPLQMAPEEMDNHLR